MANFNEYLQATIATRIVSLEYRNKIGILLRTLKCLQPLKGCVIIEVTNLRTRKRIDVIVIIHLENTFHAFDGKVYTYMSLLLLALSIIT